MLKKKPLAPVVWQNKITLLFTYVLVCQQGGGSYGKEGERGHCQKFTMQTLTSLIFLRMQTGEIYYIHATIQVIHDLWTLLQKMISKVFMIEKVNINMGPFLKDYRVMGVLNSCQCPPVIHVLQVTLHNLEPWRKETANRSCNSQFPLFTIKQQHALQPAVVFSQTRWQHRSV